MCSEEHQGELCNKLEMKKYLHEVVGSRSLPAIPPENEDPNIFHLTGQLGKKVRRDESSRQSSFQVHIAVCKKRIVDEKKKLNIVSIYPYAMRNDKG